MLLISLFTPYNPEAPVLTLGMKAISYLKINKTPSFMVGIYGVYGFFQR